MAEPQERPSGRDALVGLGLALLLAALALGAFHGFVVFLAASLAAALVALLARAQIGGYTGDVLGAVQQAAETVALLSAVALI